MKENAKLQSVVIENKSLKKVVAKLEDKIQETDERLNKIELKESLMLTNSLMTFLRDAGVSRLSSLIPWMTMLFDCRSRSFHSWTSMLSIFFS